MKKIILFILFVASIGLHAQTVHTVVNTNDAGLGSLRAAADSAVAGDIIRFSASLIASGSDTITLTTGEIAFGAKGIIIKGLYNATDSLCISGNNTSRIFSFIGAGRVVLDSLTLVNGNGIGAGFSGYGGAVYRQNGYDTLFVTNSIISGNVASNSNGQGGGVYSYSSSVSSSLVSVSNSTISGNTASGSGGGIYSSSASSNSVSSSFVSVSNSTISGNTASGSGGGIYSYSASFSNSSLVSVSNSTISGNTASGTGTGGGIYSSSSVSVSNSTISGNTASSRGGGIYSTSSLSSSSVSVSNSTISGNTAGLLGGGVYSSSSSSLSSSSVSIINSTLSGNTAGYGGGIYSSSYYSFVSVSKSTLSGNAASYGGGIYSSSNSNSSSSTLVSVSNSTIFGNIASNNGGGIFSFSNSSSPTPSLIMVTSSIIAENGSNSSGIYNNQTPTITSGGYNVFSDILMGTIGSDSTNVTTAQLNLQALAFDGGATQIMLPGVGSIAIDNGNPNDTSDAQNGPINGVREIGAAETCFAETSSISVTECSLYTVPSGNFTYTQSGVYLDTLSTVCGADSVVTINLTIINSSTATITETACDSYTSPSGNYVWTNSNTYMDTIPNAANCDSIITVDLTINNFTTAAITATACDSYTSPSGNYTWTNSNTYMDTIPNAANCDSIITINLTINNPTTAAITATACDSYTSPSGNYTWTSSNTYMDTILNATNCDSIITVNLTINNSDQITDVISACNNYTWINGVTYTSGNNTATQLYTNAHGCDSLITLNLTISTTQYATDVITACGSYTWNNVSYSSNNNTAKDTLLTVMGCDSIVTLDLTIIQPSSGTDVVSACDSYTWNGVVYSSNNNTALDTLVNAAGCDSILTLDLTILNSTSSIETVTACDSYLFNGITYTASNSMATHILVNAAGCDSIITLNLTINNSDQLTDVISACNSYTWMDGVTYTSSNNTATQLYTNADGCDSLVTLNLTISTTQYATDVITACESYTWNGVIYSSNNNIAKDTLLSVMGCDSMVTLDLTILQPSSGTAIVSACDSYTWNGVVYTSNNTTALDTLVSSMGCDSIVTLNLTILNSTSSIDVITSCNPITWMDGITYTASNSTATQTGVNAVGCDSIITLDFTLLPATSFTDVITSCTPITWIDGISYNQTTNSPSFTIPNNQGCDSVVTLDFTLLEVDTSVTRNNLTLSAQATSATYQWVDCDNGRMAGETNASFTVAQNGNYQVEITQNGCVDSSACFAITNVGVLEPELIGVSLFPNPTRDVLHINKESNASLKIMIINSAGATVHQSTSKNQITTIDMAKMASGMYVVILKNELGMKVEKVVKR